VQRRLEARNEYLIGLLKRLQRFSAVLHHITGEQIPADRKLEWGLLLTEIHIAAENRKGKCACGKETTEGIFNSMLESGFVCFECQERPTGTDLSTFVI
jgi:hypothetical protein